MTEQLKQETQEILFVNTMFALAYSVVLEQIKQQGAMDITITSWFEQLCSATETATNGKTAYAAAQIILLVATETAADRFSSYAENF